MQRIWKLDTENYRATLYRTISFKFLCPTCMSISQCQKPWEKYLFKGKLLFLDSEVKLFEVMKEAGVLPDLADIIARTKEGHSDRMKAIETALSGKMKKMLDFRVI